MIEWYTDQKRQDEMENWRNIVWAVFAASNNAPAGFPDTPDKYLQLPREASNANQPLSGDDALEAQRMVEKRMQKLWEARETGQLTEEIVN